MKPHLLNYLADPIHHQPLTLDEDSLNYQEIISGQLLATDGQIYPIVDGIPRFVLTEDSAQRQTEASFGFKWQQQDTYSSPHWIEFSQKWMAEKYGFASVAEMQNYWNQPQRILDAGCGAGYSSSLSLLPDNQAEWVGLDISVAVDVAQERLSHLPNTYFVQGDVLQAPFLHETFDIIFSEGVLHHTPSTQQAIAALVPLLKKGGEMMFYVYRKKGAIREFTDDYIRHAISDLPPQEAWEILRPLTSLGQTLAELGVEIEVKEDIPLLGITAGTYDIQRFFYWHVAKMFWNSDFDFEENHHVNFDWYHPAYAHRQTEAEVRQWCADLGLEIFHFHSQESGLTIRARRA